MHRTVLIVNTSLIIHFLCGLTGAPTCAQQLENPAALQFRKLYLHTDREYYFAGDTIWLKGYYLEGLTQQFVAGFNHMVTGLFDADGKSILQQALRIENGIAYGSINIPDTLEPGNYLLGASTSEQEFFGEDAFFHKTLKISQVRSSLVQPEEVSRTVVPEIDLALLPEGGILLAGIPNVVAIRAIDHLGRGLTLNGTITDGQGNVAADFSTGFNGMDTIHFLPVAGETYRAQLIGYPAFEKMMDKPAARGLKIGLSGESEEQLLFNVTANTPGYTGNAYFFAIMHSGRVIFDQRFRLRENVFPVKVNRTALPPGINRFILLDSTMRPISERLYFSRQRDINPVTVIPDQEQYGTRSLVSVELLDKQEAGGNAFSHLSVTVVDEKAVPANGPGVDILSWLLVSSELKGRIDSPADFFRDDETLSSSEKLDLLMLTQGWSSYRWNDLQELSPGTEKLRDGFSIAGKVTNPVTYRPVRNADVLMSVFSPGLFIIEETVADEEGRFLFDNLVFEDTATAFFQARNRRGNLYTNISLEPLKTPFPELPGKFLPVEGPANRFPAGLTEQQYYNDRALQEYLIRSGAIMLEEVTIYEERREEENRHFRIYPKPFYSFEVTDRDRGYLNVIDFLQGRVAGLVVMGNTIMIRGPSSFGMNSPLFLLNGVPVDQDLITSLPMSSIETVELMKDPAELGIFGVRGASGVISVFTRKGPIGYDDSFSTGIITRKIEGYAPYREFYSPGYTADNLDAERPDQRITLYWNPGIVTGEGKATLSFFTSDNLARYRIFVEGITRNGEICMGSASFTVERDRESPPVR